MRDLALSLLVGLLVWCLLALAFDAGRTTERQARDAVACAVNFDTLFVIKRVR